MIKILPTSDKSLILLSLELLDLMDDIDALSYPTAIVENAPFLPPINLKCATNAARNYLNTSSLVVTGFFDAIAEGCSSDGLSFGGGYNSTSQELALNIVLNLGGSRNLEQALKSLAHLVDLPLEESFFEQLSVLDDIELGGSLLIDLTIGGTINRDNITSGSYGVDLAIRVNSFLAEASLRTDQAITVEFPVLIAGTGLSPASELVFRLNGGIFDIDFSIELKVRMLYPEYY